MKVIHSWLKEYVGEALPAAEKVEELLNDYAFEIEGVEQVDGESVIDVDVLPNRASDCMSHRGVARELATILDTELSYDPLQKTKSLSEGTKITVNIADEKLCARFTAAVITGVKVAPSPEWLQKKLEALGQRSINNVVDATNYVMHAIGQPTHAFDFAKLGKDDEGRVNITIRLGQEGESLTLLSGEEITSDENTLHLVDGNSSVLLDLAGIKGGMAAELTDDTIDIVVTSGNFNYQSVRKTAQRLRVTTDASQRFQNQPSPELAEYGLTETVALILDLAGGECDGMVEVYPIQIEPVITKVTVEAINSLLGLNLTEKEVVDILSRVATKVEKTAEGLLVTAPWERKDLNIEEDYIEEVGRIHGLKNIIAVIPEKAPLAEINLRQYYGDKIRQALITAGFSEVITSSFHKKGKLQLRNALASDKSYLRGSLVKNLTKVLGANYDHTDLLGVTDVRVFEIGTVFAKIETGVTEHVSLSLGARVKGNGYNPKDDAILKIGCDAVAAALGIEVDWQIEKGQTEVNFTELLKSLPMPVEYSVFSEHSDITYKTISPYPAITRDISLWVAEEEKSEIIAETLVTTAGSLLVRHDLFDTFTKEGKTSYAFRLVFQSTDRTLTDEEINKVMEEINKVVDEKGWEVR